MVTGFQQTRNVAKRAHRHFEIDPAALIASEPASREGGPQILGYYHSHPSGSVEPSQTDADRAAPDGRYWLIIDGGHASAWRAVDNGQIFGRFDPISLDCTDAKGQTAAE